MSILIKYKPIINTLCFIGMCPIVINSKKQRAANSAFRLIYILSLFFIIGYYCGRLSYEIMKISYTFDVVKTSNIVDYTQSALAIIIYFLMIINCIQQRKVHVQFLNKLAEIDQEIMVKLKISSMDGKLFFYRIYMRNVFYIIWFVGFNLTMIYYVNKNSTTLENLNTYLIVFINVAFGLISLHITFCANMLANRFEIVYQRLSMVLIRRPLTYDKSICELFSFVEDLWFVKKKFGQNFGGLVLLNATFDFIMMTMNIYMIIYMSIYTKKLNVIKFVVVWLAMILPHIVKTFYVVFALDHLAFRVKLTLFSLKYLMIHFFILSTGQ